VSGVRAVTMEPARGAGATSGPRYPRLSPGPGQSREGVASHQRARLHAAMIELVAEHGYGALTVRELVCAAGVSTRAFYRHFGGKEECLLATHKLIVRRSACRVIAAQKGCTDRREQLRLAVGAYGSGIARNPKAARLALVDTFAVWPAALVLMQRTDGAFEAMINASSVRAPNRAPAPPLVVKGIVSGFKQVTRARLLAGSEREMPQLADELVEWVLCYRGRAAGALGQLAYPGAPARSRRKVAADRASAEQRLHWNERARILAATAGLAAEDGYWCLSAPRIRAAAGVSRKSFDMHFQDTQECFFAAVELLTARALADAARAADGREWPAGLIRMLWALCVSVAQDPVLARLGFVEVLAPGPAGVRHRERLIAIMVEDLRAGAPAEQRPSRLAAEASIGAVWGVIQRHIAAGRSQQLPRIASVLSYLALAPAIGARPALEAIAAERACMEAGGAARRRSRVPSLEVAAAR
jgi:AcrR family transcriptional regulator